MITLDVVAFVYTGRTTEQLRASNAENILAAKGRKIRIWTDYYYANVANVFANKSTMVY